MKITFFFIAFFFFLTFAREAHAIYDPNERPNNKAGIHILFPTELGEAARLVNSSGGEWGYVTIPIQFGDRDLEKWQQFFDEARVHKIIPIVRVTTEGDYFNTHVWRIPTENDILDFANFLDSLHWPTKNRYVMVMNEVNRSDEWGGTPPDPGAYADILSYAIEIFKSKSPDYFIIMAGMDNAAPQDGINYYDNRQFIQEMHRHDPTLFNRVDGLSSHSYPNPAFAQPPNYSGFGTTEYLAEKRMIESYRSRPIPVFITETGWSSEAVAEATIARYTEEMLNYWLGDSSVVAITPFLLNADGPFEAFSFMDNGQERERYKAFHRVSKIAGDPILSDAGSEIKGEQVVNKKVLSFARLPDISGRYSEFLKMYFTVVLGL